MNVFSTLGFSGYNNNVDTKGSNRQSKSPPKIRPIWFKTLKVRACNVLGKARTATIKGTMAQKLPIKDTPKENNPPNKGQAESTRVYILYRKFPLKENNLSIKDKTADPEGVLSHCIPLILHVDLI